MKNIIFFLDAQKGASGGGKVIYQYSSYINSLQNYSSSIIHLKKKKIKKIFDSLNKKFKRKAKNYSGWKLTDLEVKKNHSFPWFNIKINTKNNLIFDSKKDFVVLPEIFAHFAEDLLIKKNIPYAIFVQNGYAIFPTNNLDSLNKSYSKAKFILSYSKDISECVSYAYPKVKKKIINTVCSINVNKFKEKIKKQNLITYMPRKLRKHSELVISFMRNNLPKKWKIKAIENLNEKDVYKILNKSKIFLSFSDLEGLGIPPIEAALTGNKVIGYTGESGKEYWQRPIFTRVYSGDIKNFCKELLKDLKLDNFMKISKSQRKRLAKHFSLKKEKDSIKKFLKFI